MKALYKSQINLFDLILYPVYYSVFLPYPIWSLAEDVIVRQIALYSIPVFCYLIWYVFINIYYFHEDRVEIVYLFRVFNRKKIVLYSDITEVRYINGGGWAQPIVVFVYKGKSFKKIFWPSNSFTHRRFKRRKEILLFLHSKGIPMIIKTVFEKDKEIYDKNTPNVWIQK